MSEYQYSDPFFWWLTGLIDGRGCFYYARTGGQGFYKPQFQLKVRDDKGDLLYVLKEKTGFGRIQHTKREGRSQPQLVWYISKKADCLELVEWLTNHPLQSYKHGEFLMWKEAVKIWASKTHQGSVGFNIEDKMNKIRQAHTKSRRYK